MASATQTRPQNAAQALAALREGNERFVKDVRTVSVAPMKERREELASGQAPFAVVLSCADSRVPPELAFDAGLGDLFVVRVAGNVCDPSLLASIEFAATAFKPPPQLVVVMGHTQCGAIKATMSVLESGNPAPSENLADLVDRITPAVRGVLNSGKPAAEIVRAATHANVRAAATQLRSQSSILDGLAREGKLTIVGAEYALETGKVDFFDDA
jgi:carbonic anhydrase